MEDKEIMEIMYKDLDKRKDGESDFEYRDRIKRRLIKIQKDIKRERREKSLQRLRLLEKRYLQQLNISVRKK